MGQPKAVMAFLFACLSLSVLSWGQTTPGVQKLQPTRDPAGVATVQSALLAMGGSGAIGAIQDCVAEGTIQAPADSWMTSGSFIWKDAGTEFRYENPGSGSQEIFVSGHGHPAATINGKVVHLFFHSSEAHFPFHLPALVLFRELQDSRYSVGAPANVTVNGRPAVRIQTSLDADNVTSAYTRQEWYLDAATGLPLRVEYQIPEDHNALQLMPAAIEFAAFRSVSGIAVPFQITSYHDGQQGSIATLASVAFNTGVSPSDFDAPTGGGR